MPSDYVEGIMAIQSGENPKFLRERLMTFMNQKLREGGESGSGTGEKRAEAPQGEISRGLLQGGGTHDEKKKAAAAVPTGWTPTAIW